MNFIAEYSHERGFSYKIPPDYSQRAGLHDDLNIIGDFNDSVYYFVFECFRMNVIAEIKIIMRKMHRNHRSRATVHGLSKPKQD